MPQSGTIARVSADIAPGTTQHARVDGGVVTGNDPNRRVATAVLPYLPVMDRAPSAARSADAAASVRITTAEGNAVPGADVALVPVLPGDSADAPREGAPVGRATTRQHGTATFGTTQLDNGDYRAVSTNLTVRTVDINVANAPAAPPSTPEAPPAVEPPAPPSSPAAPPAGETPGAPAVPQAPSAPTRSADRAGTATVTAKAVGGRNKLRVDVNPEIRGSQWRFKLQAKTASGVWKTLKRTYTTKGLKHVRTINLKKGTYRVQVLPLNNYTGTTSATVTLSR